MTPNYFGNNEKIRHAIVVYNIMYLFYFVYVYTIPAGIWMTICHKFPCFIFQTMAHLRLYTRFTWTNFAYFHGSYHWPVTFTFRSIQSMDLVSIDLIYLRIFSSKFSYVPSTKPRNNNNSLIAVGWSFRSAQTGSNTLTFKWDPQTQSHRAKRYSISNSDGDMEKCVLWKWRLTFPDGQAPWEPQIWIDMLRSRFGKKDEMTAALHGQLSDYLKSYGFVAQLSWCNMWNIVKAWP